MNNKERYHWRFIFQSLEDEYSVFSQYLHELKVLRRTKEFYAHMTIEQAWQHHPKTKVVFASVGLPRCHKCFVRFEETLQEAAEAYDIDLQKWLIALNDLVKEENINHDT